jgi:phage baseplate assembly protein W
MNITTVSGFDQFKASVTDPSSGSSRVDLILSCVDNYEARITINQVRLFPLTPFKQASAGLFKHHFMFFDQFKASVTDPSSGSSSRVDLILSCVDNYEARITINQVRRVHLGTGMHQFMCLEQCVRCAPKTNDCTSVDSAVPTIGQGACSWQQQGGPHPQLRGQLRSTHKHQPGEVIT